MMYARSTASSVGFVGVSRFDGRLRRLILIVAQLDLLAINRLFRRQALADFCQALFSANEFVYVD